MVGVVHKQRPVHIGQLAFLDESVGNVVQSLICLLKGGIDLVIVHGECIGEVEFHDDVVLIAWEVDEVLRCISEK